MNLPPIFANWRRLAWILLVVISLIVAAAIFLQHLLEEQALTPIRMGETQRTLRRAESMQRSLKVPIDDVVFLARTPAARGAVNDFSPASLDRFAEVAAIVAESGTPYEQVRLLDAHGMERLRINHHGMDTLRVPEQLLQDKSSRYYFTRARNLADGKVFISRIDLNVESGKIEIPYVPTLRVSTPMHDANGTLKGVLVLNIAVDDLTPIFSTLVPGIRPAWMIDQAGFWLKAPRPDMEWGFQLGKPDARLETSEPLVAKAARATSADQLTTASGLWTFAQVSLPDSSAIAAASESDNQFRNVTIVSQVPTAQLQEAVARTREITFIAAAGVGTILVLLTAATFAAFEARKRQAHDAEMARQRLRLALVGGGLSMWIVELAGQGIYLNASWQQITGYPQGPSTMDEWIEVVHVDDRAAVLNAFAEMRAGRLTSVELPLRLKHQDGHWLTLGLYGGVVERRADGTASQAAGVLRDISLVEQSEKRLELALHGGDMSWWDWNVPGGTVKLDARWGLITGEAPGTTRKVDLPVASAFEHAVHLEDRAALGAAIDALLCGQRNVIAAEYRVRRNDGGWAWVLARGEVMERSESGSPTRVLGTFKDITQRKRLEIELKEERRLLEQRVEERTHNLDQARLEAERANTAKNTFLANISHEMRTPMHGIIGFSDMGQKLDASVPAEIVTSYFTAINQSAARLLGLLNDLLDISKLESGLMSFNPESIDSGALIASNVTELEALAGQKNLRLQVVANEALPKIFADSIRIGQVIRNLLANAIRYSPDNGTIRIEASEVGGEQLGIAVETRVLRLFVSDHGCGIPDGELEAIFDKFVQSTRTRSGAGGTGLGLSICRDIVTYHHGQIRAFNNEQGGASFEVLLPEGTAA